jgi:hypothetical protein
MEMPQNARLSNSVHVITCTGAKVWPTTILGDFGSSGPGILGKVQKRAAGRSRFRIGGVQVPTGPHLIVETYVVLRPNHHRLSVPRVNAPRLTFNSFF